MFSNSVGMEFGVEKCAVLTIKNGKMANRDVIVLQHKTIMKGLGSSYLHRGRIRANG